ncbi:hypothetical protein [Streptomyces profundus]|uniref:hypothetical protein n=1 Tax=Streptomyces profundus TaxID=2867410 RepID=UPI001D16C5E6|nr:hypothetical protein [Streptomyces sp. MA3_2.13]UED86412.1 hypothetical protein K4G22_21290 [Streptomyces sp. MA3_2.13]
MSLAVRFSEYGGTDVLRVVDVPPPTWTPGGPVGADHEAHGRHGRHDPRGTLAPRPA